MAWGILASRFRAFRCHPPEEQQRGYAALVLNRLTNELDKCAAPWTEEEYRRMAEELTDWLDEIADVLWEMTSSSAQLQADEQDFRQFKKAATRLRSANLQFANAHSIYDFLNGFYDRLSPEEVATELGCYLHRGKSRALWLRYNHPDATPKAASTLIRDLKLAADGKLEVLGKSAKRLSPLAQELYDDFSNNDWTTKSEVSNALRNRQSTIQEIMQIWQNIRGQDVASLGNLSEILVVQ